MTETTYRVEIVHDPHSTHNPWDAHIYTEGNLHVCRVYGPTPDDALAAAQEWIRAEQSSDGIRTTYHLDGNGNLVDAPLPTEPQSLDAHRASRA